MAELRYVVKGTTPLLMHNPATSMKGGGGMSRRKIPTPEAEALAGLYVSDGHLFFPAVGLRNSLLSGAKGYRVGRVAATGILAGAIILIDESFPVLDGKGKPWPSDKYEIDIRRAVVQDAGILRARPKLELPWRIEARFGFVPEIVELSVIKEVLVRAGMVVGIGDYRPEKMGWFGRYEVVDLRVV